MRPSLTGLAYRGDTERLRIAAQEAGAGLVERITEQADRAEHAARTAVRAAWGVVFSIALAAVGTCGFWLAGVVAR
jgi:hypothetical protein